MDILERAVDLLGPAAELESRSATSQHGAGNGAPDRVERAVSLAGLDETAAPAPSQRESAGVVPAQPAAPTPTSRAATIDLQLLRERRIITPNEERSPMTESFRRVKRHILAAVTDPEGEVGRNLVMIASSLPGEGKTFCSINLAMSLAMELDYHVLLVDADVAKPSVLAALGMKVESPRGFMDILADRSIPFSEVMYKTNVGKLTVMPAGVPNQRATEVLAGEAAAALFTEMATRYDDRVIIFDSAPLLSASESTALASHMGQVVVVVESGRTTERTLKEALKRIESCNTAGVLLNKGARPSAALGGGYGYRYGYGYGA